MTRPRHVPALWMLLCQLLSGCASPTDTQYQGLWSDQNVSLTLTESGGSVTYPCGVGTIDAAWRISSSGVFTANGDHQYGGGPLPSTGRPRHPARYDGRFQGDTLTFRSTVLDTGDTLGPFKLFRGGREAVEICD